MEAKTRKENKAELIVIGIALVAFVVKLVTLSGCEFCKL